MIKITVSRNGMLAGTSIIPTQNVHNVYFLFGSECSEENQAELGLRLDEAKAMHKRVQPSVKTMGGVMPEYILRTLLLWQSFQFRGPISYPEAGCIPGVQSFMMCLFVVMQRAYPDADLEIITVSEYMVRMSQLLVAAKELSPDEIQIFDTPIDGEPANISFQLPDEFCIA